LIEAGDRTNGIDERDIPRLAVEEVPRIDGSPDVPDDLQDGVIVIPPAQVVPFVPVDVVGGKSVGDLVRGVKKISHGIF